MLKGNENANTSRLLVSCCLHMCSHSVGASKHPGHRYLSYSLVKQVGWNLKIVGLFHQNKRDWKSEINNPPDTTLPIISLPRLYYSTPILWNKETMNLTFLTQTCQGQQHKHWSYICLISPLQLIGVQKRKFTSCQQIEFALWWCGNNSHLIFLL